MSALTPEIRAIARSSARMLDLFRWLESVPDSRDASRGMDLRQEAATTVLEQFVESGIEGGGGICFWLECRISDERTVVEAAVLFQSDSGQHTLSAESVIVGTKVAFARALEAMSSALWRWRENGVERVRSGDSSG